MNSPDKTLTGSTLLGIVSTVFDIWEGFDQSHSSHAFTTRLNAAFYIMWAEEKQLYMWAKQHCYWTSHQTMRVVDAYVAKHGL